MYIVTVKIESYGSYAEKINMSYFCLNLGQTAEDSDMFTIIWLRPRGLILEELGTILFYLKKKKKNLYFLK